MDTGFLHKNIPNHYAICRLLELLPVLLFEIIHHRALKVFDPALNAPFQNKHLEVTLPPEFGNSEDRAFVKSSQCFQKQRARNKGVNVREG